VTRYVRGGAVSSADGAMITYLARGSGPVVVCIHGGLGTALSLMPLSDYLGDEFEMVFVNCRAMERANGVNLRRALSASSMTSPPFAMPSDLSRRCSATHTARLWP
jgi:pimeloyl-ACP methyl ester carboxylesterase